MNIKKSLPIALALYGIGNPAMAEKKTNVLFILIDDMSSSAVECYGNKLVKTPNMDQIAHNGVQFTQGYVCSQSTPSRAALLTGQYPSRNQMWHVVPKYSYPNARVEELDYLDNLPREQFTMAEAMKTGGYNTAIYGKWHLSTWDNDGYYTYLWADKARFYGFDDLTPKQNPLGYHEMGDKGVDFLTDEALAFMEKSKDKPFFIYLAQHTLHDPIFAPNAMVQKYRDLGYPEKGMNSATYLACIEHLDNSIGRIQKKLVELGIDKNTIVFFVSDNGGVDSEISSSPLRYGKGSPYEGGTRVPFMVQWLGKIKGGQVCKTPVHIVDVYPTLLDIAHIKKPENHVLDGESLMPLMLGNKAVEKRMANRPIYFYQPIYDLLWQTVPSASMVEGDYKLIWFFGDYIDREQNNKYITEGRLELYNLTNDLSEKHDLAPSNPERAQAMKAKLEQFIKSCGSQIPGPNEKYNPEKWSDVSKGRKEE